MKYFLDTEFAEHEKGIELISIGIVCENGKEFYAESSNFVPSYANTWVLENVFPYLKNKPVFVELGETKSDTFLYPLEEIKNKVIDFTKEDPSPEFYAYYADYDWVMFARIFGQMVDLPENYPMWCIDLKQMMWERGLNDQWKDEMYPPPEKEHNALEDAKWNFKLYKEIRSYDESGKVG